MAKKKETAPPLSSEEQKKVDLEAAKAEFHKALLYAQKIAQRNISNPASSQQSRGQSYSTYTKENILTWLKNPSTNAKSLRNASMYLYNASPLYRRLINYQANMWLWDYVLYPLGYDESKMKANNLQKQYLAAAKKCEVWNLKNELSKAAVSAVREGIFFGVSWESGDSFFIQKINADYCTVEAIADGTYLYTVDMSQIKEDELGFYPPEFTKMWNAYKSDGVKRQFVPEEISWCLPFCTADGDQGAFIPPYVGCLPDLLDIENYKALQETATELANYKVLVGRIDLDSQGAPTIDWNLAMQYYTHLCNALPPQVGAAVLPFKVEDFNFDQDRGISTVDIVTRSVEQYWENCGSNSVLHGGKTDTSGGMSLAITTDSELLLGFLGNAQRLVNRHLKYLSGTIKFQIQFLSTTIYNRKDIVGIYKEAATYGVTPSMYFAALGLTPLMVSGLNRIENDIIGVDKLKPLLSSHTTPSEEIGRPAEDESDLSDEGARTRDKQ